MDKKETEYRSYLNGLCNDKGLKNYDLFVNFMVLRFPDERHENYIFEWIDRFKSGDVTMYMDFESLNLYINLIKAKVVR